MLTTHMKTHPMNIHEFFIKRSDLFEVSKLLSESGAKYYPFERKILNHDASFIIGYKIRVTDHPIASFIAIKYAQTV